MIKSRTWLFTPGNNLKMLEKGLTLPADVVIFDLEDAVELTAKEDARSLVKKQLMSAVNAKPYLVVRINNIDSSFYEKDIMEVVQANLFGIMVPKAEKAEHFCEMDKKLSEIEQSRGIEIGKIKLFPLVETALGIENALEIALSSSRINRLVFGAIDYVMDIQGGLTREGTELLYARGKLINTSRAAGLEGPIDTVFTEFTNEKYLIEETERVKNMGFKGKLVIHPRQIDIVNNILSPSDDEILEAKQIIEVYEKAQEQGIGAVQYKGKMIDLPVVERARNIVQYHKEL